VSVDDADEARIAEAAGADYVAVTVWSTATKPEAEPRGLTGVASVAAATSLPVVGIGGITPDNAPEVLAAGASGVAVISAVGAAEDPVAATRRLVAAVHAGGRA
jgi:thiamine-phosphate pyrophosphorylase